MHDYFTNWILQKKEGTKYFLLAKKQWANLAVTVNRMVSLRYTKRSLWMCTSRCFCITSTSSPWATAEWSLGRWWPRHFPQLPSRSHIFWWEPLCTTRCLTERVGCNPIVPQLCRFGPCLMSRHPPFSLRPLVFLYNLSKLSSIALIIVIIMIIVFIVFIVFIVLIVFIMIIVHDCAMCRLCGSQLLHRGRDLPHVEAAQLQLALSAGPQSSFLSGFCVDLMWCYGHIWCICMIGRGGEFNN